MFNYHLLRKYFPLFFAFIVIFRNYFYVRNNSKQLSHQYNDCITKNNPLFCHLSIQESVIILLHAHCFLFRSFFPNNKYRKDLVIITVYLIITRVTKISGENLFFSQNRKQQKS